jgi:hypothetical protein
MSVAVIKSAFKQAIWLLRRHWLLSLMLLLVFSTAWLAVNAFLLIKISDLNTNLAAAAHESQRLQVQLNDVTRHRDFLQTELSVEKNTNQLLQDDLKHQQAELFELKKQLAVYQQIITPEPAAGSLVIESFRLRKVPDKPGFRFELALIDQNKQQNQSRAQLEIWLKVKRKKRLQQIDLLKLAGFKAKDKKLLVQNFRTVGGEFTLPTGIVVQELEIRLVAQTAKAGQRAQLIKTVKWDGVGEILD